MPYPYVTVGRENTADIGLYYEDHGSGPLVVLVHGYLADGRSWEKQELALLADGYRVVSYDRRGCGFSSRPSTGYDYDTLARDLNALLEALDLRDVVLVGCCAGTGEVVRYLGTYGQRRVRAAALIVPWLDASAGRAEAGFRREFSARLADDRPAAIKTYLDKHYNLDLLGGGRVSDQAWLSSFRAAIGVSPAATLSGATAWQEDFHADLARITVPMLIVRAGEDQIAPLEGDEHAVALLADARIVVVPAGPHAIIWTHAAEVNAELLGFLDSL